MVVEDEVEVVAAAVEEAGGVGGGEDINKTWDLRKL